MSEETNVFLSWSGPRARMMAEALHGWLRRVIQSARPFHSDKDIESGAFWDEVVKAHLKTARFAIVCCTPENVSAPWLNYEAGALAERLNGRTAPLLLGSKPEALKIAPLSRLQAREADREGTLHVVRSLNANLLLPLDEAILAEVFEEQWPKLKEKLDAIPGPVTTKPPDREPPEMLAELVRLTRQIAADMPTKLSLDELTRRVYGYPSGAQGPQGATYDPQAGIVGPQGFNIPPARHGQVTFRPSKSFGTELQDDDAFAPDTIRTREFRELVTDLVRNMQSHLGIAKLDHKLMLAKVLALIDETSAAEGITYGQVRALVAAVLRGAI